MMIKRAHQVPWILIIALALLLTGSTFHRALVASFTHDESFTYNHYVTASLADIFSYKVVSPNNHLLNTLLMKTGAVFFGPSAIVLRFPNILAHFGFLVFSLLLLRKLNPWIILPLFALVNCNPYLLDFFALARGNGLSYFFLLGSIYFFIRYAGHLKLQDYFWSVSFAFLGVLSHFTMLYYFLPLIVVANLWPCLERFITGDRAAVSPGRYARINALNVIGLLALGIIISGPVRKLISANQFFYGGENGFWKDTVGTLIETFFYGIKYGFVGGILMHILILSVIFSTVVLFIYVVFKKDRILFFGNHMLFIVLFLLLISVFINISQFHLIGTKLLIRRYGLLFDPMFMLCLCFLCVALFRPAKKKHFSILSCV